MTKSSWSDPGDHLLSTGHTWTDGDHQSWGLKKDLPVKVLISPEEVEVLTVGERVEQFGIGDSVGQALHDFLTSLSDILQSLEKREERLGSSALDELNWLRELVCRRT